VTTTRILPKCWVCSWASLFEEYSCVLSRK